MLVGMNYLFQLGTTYYLGIILRVVTNSKIGTNLMYMSLLTTIRKNPMCIISNLWMIHKRFKPKAVN